MVKRWILSKMVKELLASRYSLSRLSQEATSAHVSSYKQETTFSTKATITWQGQLRKFTSCAIFSESSWALREEFREHAPSEKQKLGPSRLDFENTYPQGQSIVEPYPTMQLKGNARLRTS
jgi:hypothetical protein